MQLGVFEAGTRVMREFEGHCSVMLGWEVFALRDVGAGLDTIHKDNYSELFYSSISLLVN